MKETSLLLAGLMNKHFVLPSLALALAFSVQCLQAEAEPPATAPGANGDTTASGKSVIPVDLTKKRETQGRKNENKARKKAETQFRNSPQGIVLKKQIMAVDDEVNGVYEKYLNIWREDPATERGKKLRAERDRELRLLTQKKKELESDFQKLMETSPVYREILEEERKQWRSPLARNPAKPSSSKETKDRP